LFIETSRMPGRGRLEITGQLGDVMKESARAALTYVRSNADRLGVDPGSSMADIQCTCRQLGAKDGPRRAVNHLHRADVAAHGRKGAVGHGDDRRGHLRGRCCGGGIKAKCWPRIARGSPGLVLPEKNARIWTSAEEVASI